jgi:flagellum-specific peptidoglycan hydrolase FlgJ
VRGNPLNLIDRLGLAACPPNVKAFFQALGPTINQMSEDMDIDPNYLFALSAFESGWWGSHAQSLNNPFGLTHGGGNDIQFSSVSSAADFFEDNIGPSVVDAGSMDEFMQDLRSEGYNSANPNYDQNLENVYKSVQKFKKNCDCMDQSSKK